MSSTPLLDGRRSYCRHVIASDQTCAVRCDPRRCVGANALARIPGVLDVRVGVAVAKLLFRDGWHRFTIPADVRAVVQAYDESGTMLPVGFPFRIVPPVTPLGARAGERPGSDRRSGRNESVATRRPSRRHVDVDPQRVS